VLFALLAVAAAFIVLRMVVYFVSSIPKWVYVLVLLGAFCAVVFIFFGTTVARTFGF
jgi:hypothetical protein